MTGRGDHGDDDFDDAFEPERDDRPGAGRDDSEGAGEAELLDQSWQQSHGGGGGGWRWQLVLLVIPVVALVVLQLGPDAPHSASPTPSHAPSSTAPTPGPDDTGQRARSGRRTAGAGPVVKNLGHRVLGVTAGWELFVRGTDSVARVQLAKGRVTTTKVAALGDNPVSFFITSAGAFALAQSEAGGVEVLDGHRAKPLSATDVASGAYGAFVPGPDPGHVWALGQDNEGRSVAVLLDSRLHRAGTVRRLPDNASRGQFMGGGSDGAGTLLATTPGGTYAVEKSGLQRITPGAVVGAGPTRWLVVECDDVNRCTHSVINRKTGTRRALQVRVPQGMQGFQPVGRISPDGSMMASMEFDQRGRALVLTELLSGTRHQVGHLNAQGFGTSGTFAWSPDSRWLIYAADTGELTAVDAQTRKSTVLDLGLDFPIQVAVRPAP